MIEFMALGAAALFIAVGAPLSIFWQRLGNVHENIPARGKPLRSEWFWHWRGYNYTVVRTRRKPTDTRLGPWQ